MLKALVENLVIAAALGAAERGSLDVYAAFGARQLRRTFDRARDARVGDAELLAGLEDAARQNAIAALSAGRVREGLGSRVARANIARVTCAYRAAAR